MATIAQIVGEDVLGRILSLRSRVRVRLMRAGETFPSHWELGFDQLGTLDPDWVAVAELAGVPVGAIVASPCHGTVIVWRVVADGGSPAVIRALLHEGLRIAHGRGMRGYVAPVNLEIPTQRKLARLIERMGGKDSGISNLTLVAGALPTKGGHECRS